MTGIPGYETTQEAAMRFGVDDSQVRRLCIARRIPGAVKVGRQWLIPSEAWPEQTGFGRPPEWRRWTTSPTLYDFLGVRRDEVRRLVLEEALITKLVRPEPGRPGTGARRWLLGKDGPGLKELADLRWLSKPLPLPLALVRFATRGETILVQEVVVESETPVPRDYRTVVADGELWEKGLEAERVADTK
ncbi:helix-turn-helix domain-containing protein [Rubrobacter tropicus]|uniref:Helix-turn-helix domain-containing protein n=1 Tax=Rubrobacter tropicus TaxID=2653851 RepID=A0A6G8Q585_9ACTN|nr:helix-turn-helix domain-containing protein [Rubrobacter tropicus]QIN81579.1 helix-turn-helix domain-containing protein [Rubrobacter tropicus]